MEMVGLNKLILSLGCDLFKLSREDEGDLIREVNPANRTEIG
jgi:hypothetical protein